MTAATVGHGALRLCQLLPGISGMEERLEAMRSLQRLQSLNVSTRERLDKDQELGMRVPETVTCE